MAQFVQNGTKVVSGFDIHGEPLNSTTPGDAIYFTPADAITVCGWLNVGDVTGWVTVDEVIEEGKETHPTTELPPHH